MENCLIELHNVTLAHHLRHLKSPVNFILKKGENIAIVGKNGSGKTLLVNTIIGNYPLSSGFVNFNLDGGQPYHKIKYLAFHDSYSVADYYQQRWNAADIDESPVAGEFLNYEEGDTYLDYIVDKLHINSIIDKKLILLSNGELRKFQIIKVLKSRPKVIVIDNPFIGLDGESRNSLEMLLSELSDKLGMSVVIVTAELKEIPSFITSVVEVENLECKPKVSRSDYMKSISSISLDSNYNQLIQRINELPLKQCGFSSDEIVNLHDISIRYDDRIVLDHVSWRIKRGEKWALLGNNGAGKTTLLSLIYADNPMAYACDITLFGRKRGSGESIWDIKKHIGYVSPEMHRAFLKDYPSLDIVAGGFSDFMGLFITPSEEQKSICRFWLDVFGIGWLETKSFLKLSSGEQRMVLLARAFVKDPELLILDEPFHGLDPFNKMKVRTIIDAFCARPDKTLIMVTHHTEDLPLSVTKRLNLPVL